jgi:hypothetical protein
MPDPKLEEHYSTVIPALFDGRVIPFLGAGANLCGRPIGTPWQPGRYLPKGDELADYLARELGCPAGEEQVSCPQSGTGLCNIPKKSKDLSRVSQYISVTSGEGPLYEKLHKLFAPEYPSTALHQFLATMPIFFRKNNYPVRYQLIVTTNYDDILEDSFRDAKEPYDLVSYLAQEDPRGIFLHRSPDGNEHLIRKPNEYISVSPDKCTVILKIHGAVDRSKPERDSYVITEDDYIDYLTQTDISKLVPVRLAEKMKTSHFLFLGYSLGDWNMRAILHRIWGQQKRSYRSWAVRLNPSWIDERSWSRRGVDILNVHLEDYITTLRERINM